MERKLRIIIGLGIIVGILGALILPLYIFVLRPKTENNFNFPLLLLDNSTISDMVLENDNLVHFVISCFKSQNYGPTYLIVDYLNRTHSYMEYWAHCELGEEYLHYAWTQSEYKGTDTIDPEKSKLF